MTELQDVRLVHFTCVPEYAATSTGTQHLIVGAAVVPLDLCAGSSVPNLKLIKDSGSFNGWRQKDCCGSPG